MSILLYKPTTPNPSPPLGILASMHLPPQLLLYLYQLSDLLFTIKGFPSRGYMQFNMEIVLKEANVNGRGSSISWWVD